jgi:hypothetical protein
MEKDEIGQIIYTKGSENNQHKIQPKTEEILDLLGTGQNNTPTPASIREKVEEAELKARSDLSAGRNLARTKLDTSRDRVFAETIKRGNSEIER